MDITLRRARPSDAEAFERMMNRPEVYAGLAQLPYVTADFWRTKLAEPGGPGVAERHLVADVGGELAGSTGLHPVGPAVRRR